MPWYRDIDFNRDWGARTGRRLLELRTKLDREIPKRRDDALVLATWNIRDFDSKAYGYRSDEALQYIAEIISHFDIVAVAEVRADLRGLKRLMKLLGSWWDYVVTDVTAGSAGNEERLAVLFDNRKVDFGGLAGELVLPPVKTENDQDEKVVVPAAQFARTPLLAGFRSNWIDFQLAVFHIIWGSGVTVRRDELAQLTKAITEKADEETRWSRNLIVLGDFNIGSPNDVAWKDLKRQGWVVPADFVTDIRGTNVAQDKYYDQIAIRPEKGWLEFADLGDRSSAGAFNYFDVVYRPVADFDTYTPEMEAYRPNATRSNFKFDDEGRPRTVEQRRRWYRQYWRTHQMSDHLPLWVALRSDNADDYLRWRLHRTDQV